MADKPNETNQNQNPYDLLTEEDQTAVDMAVLNYSYGDIAKVMKRARATVKTWFYKGGRLYDAFKYMKKERRKEYAKKFKEIDEQLQQGAVDAAITIIEVSKRKSMTGVVAAKDVLDRAGFKPKEKVEHSNDPDNPMPETVVFYIPENGRDKDDTEHPTS